MPDGLRAGFHVHWTQPGAGDQTAVMIHCALGHGGMWQPLMAAMSDRIMATAFDLPGHGQSADWPGGTDYLGDVAAIAATFCPAPRVVIGHSFGGVAALALAVARPELVSALVLIEPVFFAVARGGDAHARHSAAFAPFLAAMETGDRAQAARHFHRLWGGGDGFESLPVAHQNAMAQRMDLIVAGAPGIEEDSLALLAPGRLEALELPVLMIRGSASPAVIGAIHQGLAARLRDGREVVVNGAGHMVPLSHPGVLAHHIGAHLDRAFQ